MITPCSLRTSRNPLCNTVPPARDCKSSPIRTIFACLNFFAQLGSLAILVGVQLIKAISASKAACAYVSTASSAPVGIAHINISALDSFRIETTSSSSPSATFITF